MDRREERLRPADNLDDDDEEEDDEDEEAGDTNIFAGGGAVLIGANAEGTEDSACTMSSSKRAGSSIAVLVQAVQ